MIRYEACLRAGIELPTSCRNGTCRACLCRLLSGSVAYRIDWPGVSAEERAEGWTLPCVAVCRSDVVVEQRRAARLSYTP
ncbi:MAG: Ferredoxin [Herbaspirillum frisingense]|uniref:Ferredoxin n=1 Tax=Herbaspirillum frisingense TaxID=92645 RepID=A0A7V8JT84_9BURK|nr:MAG: Ferredoxin [Herbaspirillum frisingense]